MALSLTVQGCRETRAVERSPATPPEPAELVVRVLDVGQGDAILITNGTSRVLVDGGPDPRRLGWLLDSLGIHDTTLDVVVLTHAHADHYSGLRELFTSRRRLRIRYFFENEDPSPVAALAQLRDSVNARLRRGEVIARDTDDPCGNGSPVCTLTLNGGAKLHVMRPYPDTRHQNNRSAALRIVGPDSASFTMWLAGDAERAANSWFAAANFISPLAPATHVLKLNHHGSCNGLSRAYLLALRPTVAIASVGSRNEYGHLHEQTLELLREMNVTWYRTDTNGTVTIQAAPVPGAGFTVRPSRGGPSDGGSTDRRASDPGCGRF